MVLRVDDIEILNHRVGYSILNPDLMYYTVRSTYSWFTRQSARTGYFEMNIHNTPPGVMDLSPQFTICLDFLAGFWQVLIRPAMGNWYHVRCTRDGCRNATGMNYEKSPVWNLFASVLRVKNHFIRVKQLEARSEKRVRGKQSGFVGIGWLIKFWRSRELVFNCNEFFFSIFVFGNELFYDGFQYS